MKFYILLLLALLTLFSPAAPTALRPRSPDPAPRRPKIFLIRPVEFSPAGEITEIGRNRRKCLLRRFVSRKTNIRKLMVPRAYPGETRTQQPIDTMRPIAAALNIPVWDLCDFFDTECAAREALGFDGPGNVLVIWETNMLHHLARVIGARDAPKIQKLSYDRIYTIPPPYVRVNVNRQMCPGLDEPKSFIMPIADSAMGPPIANRTKGVPAVNRTMESVDFTVEGPIVNRTMEIVNITMEEPVANSTNSTIETPIVDSTMEMPAANSTMGGPIVNSTLEEPIVNSTIETPIVNSTIETPTVNDTMEQPIANLTMEEPVVNSTIETPIVNSTMEKPIINSTPEKK